MGIREEQRRRTVRTILEAAGLEFEIKGYESSSYGSIAARAGVAKSLVSYHFATKADIAAQVVAEAFPGGTFLSTEPSPGGPLADILESTAVVARAFSTNPSRERHFGWSTNTSWTILPHLGPTSAGSPVSPTTSVVLPARASSRSASTRIARRSSWSEPSSVCATSPTRWTNATSSGSSPSCRSGSG
ncbi:hypothetical protein GCM10025867_43890 [Frondihabitans sucicola]|uniref:HTH tetR-type domain-containing protein n=1 Tax=Frondihabitans sucicola TaxID=1268041 RepID=A0ABM8GUJ4_9MICO|nr:TetR/AcrR family transcriptional regulator [Frondihabitans sucicola]BDZ52148.1 hypothetical protein GCM10025867_43890 [Frondihabitans sucicola]